MLWIFLENPEVLENLLVYLDFIIESNAVLTQEVEDDFVRRLQGDMLVLKRAAANSICFILTFLITSTESKLVDQINGRSELAILRYNRSQILLVISADSSDVFLRRISF